LKRENIQNIQAMLVQLSQSSEREIKGNMKSLIADMTSMLSNKVDPLTLQQYDGTAFASP